MPSATRMLPGVENFATRVELHRSWTKASSPIPRCTVSSSEAKNSDFIVAQRARPERGFLQLTMKTSYNFSVIHCSANEEWFVARDERPVTRFAGHEMAVAK